MKSLILLLCLATVFRVSTAQNLKDYAPICYCSGYETPHGVLYSDNNFELLAALKNGLSTHSLDSLNITYTQSQLKLLRIFRLVRYEDGIYYTNISILDEAQSVLLRIKSKEIADKILPGIEPEIKELVSRLNSMGRDKNAYSILFSYVLDGRVWGKFEESKSIDDLYSENNRDPWTDLFWLIIKRKGPGFGTNTYSDGNIAISVTNGGPDKIMHSFEDEEDLQKNMMENFKTSGKVTDEKVLKEFSKYNLFSTSGEITVPVIEESESNDLYRLTGLIADKICKGTLLNTDLVNLKAEYNFRNSSDALIILYHEIMWDLLAAMETKNIVERPLILREPDKAEFRDAADIIYITIQK